MHAFKINTACMVALAISGATRFVSPIAYGDIFVTNDAGGSPGMGTIGEYTDSGALVNPALVSGLTGPGAIAASGSDLFVATNGVIAEYTTSGTVVKTSLVSGFSNQPFSIAISGSNLFVSNYYNGTVGEYTTSGATVDATLISGLSQPAGIAISGSNLFVTEGNNGFAGWIGEYTTAGTTVNSSLISGFDSVRLIAISASDLIAVHDQDVISEYTTSGVPVSDSASLDSTLGDVDGIAVYGSDLFITNNNGGTVGEYTVSGTPVSANLISGLDYPSGIAIADVPEPASLSLLLLGGGMMLNRRRRIY